MTMAQHMALIDEATPVRETPAPAQHYGNASDWLQLTQLRFG